MQRERSEHSRPVGRLSTGEPYYAPIGEMLYDGDRVRCHLCGRWLKMVGGQHLIAAHDLTLEQYREMFRLLASTTTAAPETSEWHPTRNGELDPYKIGQHAHRKVWWRCSECSHEWQASPNERTSAGRGCPACGRRRSIAATVDRNGRFRVSRERSIAVVRPDLLEEWHPALNGVLDPFTVAAGSERRVSWQCSNADCRQEWQAVVGDRAKRGLGCPACGYRRGGERRALAERDPSLGALYPRLLAEWHPTRNGDLDPYAIRSQAQSADYGGAARTAGATGRRPRCRAGTARAAAAQPARSGWHGESSSSG